MFLLSVSDFVAADVHFPMVVRITTLVRTCSAEEIKEQKLANEARSNMIDEFEGSMDVV